jgi:hypothetical protein
MIETFVLLDATEVEDDEDEDDMDINWIEDDDDFSYECDSTELDEHQASKIDEAPKDTKYNYGTLKVGEIVRSVFRRELERRKIPNEELLKLQNVDLCKRFFHTRADDFAILSKRPMICNSGRTRNYAAPLTTVDGQRFYITAQWYDESRQAIINYIDFVLSKLPSFGIIKLPHAHKKSVGFSFVDRVIKFSTP